MKQHLPWIFVVSLFLFTLGSGFTPWVYRDAVALQLTAPELAEYVKFLAEQRLGQIDIQRLYFLFPLAVASLSLPLVATNRHLALYPRLSIFLRLFTIFCALRLLSPVWSPTVLLNEEFRWQTFGALIAIGLVVIGPMFSRMSLKWLSGLVTMFACLSLGIAIWQFQLSQAAIAATYASPVVLGWGAWVAVSGCVGLLIFVMNDLMMGRNDLP